MSQLLLSNRNRNPVSTTGTRCGPDDPRVPGRRRQPCSRRRHGTILVFVLVCLAVITTVLFGAVQSGIRDRQQIRTEIQLVQTEWLLDAGIGMAIRKFRESPDFAEHSFTTDESLKAYQGSVAIQVIDSNNHRASVRVTAKLQGRHRLSPVTQRSRMIELDRIQAHSTDPINDQTAG